MEIFMDDKLIRKYAGLMDELGLTAFELTENGRTFRLEKAAQTTVQQYRPAGADADVGGAPQTAAAPSDGRTDVCSPMVGVFYAAPAEDAEPYVSVGSRVKRGDVLCIIETMKLMNEITAEADGVIAEICVANGQVVDFGHVLFRMEKE